MSAEDTLQAKPPDTAPAWLSWRQTLTVTLLFAGYASYYFCRADFSVAMPMLIDELHKHGFSAGAATVHLGAIASFGVLAYAGGKLLLSGWADFWGGRRSFIAGLAGAVLFTFLFASGRGLLMFKMAWIGNRLVQSIGWAGLIKICSKWFSYRSYGIIVGILSLSFLIGDALARQSMGMLIHAGFGWRFLFVFAAVIAGCVLVANVLLLRESRTECRYSAPEVNPLNVFAHEPAEAKSDANSPAVWRRASGPFAILTPLLRNPGFWIVCFLSCGTTIIRETFNTWTPTYLHTLFGFSDAASASKSAIFPAIGAISVIVCGWAGDRLGANGRPVVFFFGMIATSVGLLMLASMPGGVEGTAPIFVTGLVGFGLLGPYSYLAGAMALDFGGRVAGATSSGLIDGFGYLGGILAGDSVARVATTFGWRRVFALLSVVAAVSAFGACVLFIQRRREASKLSPPGNPPG